MMEKVAKEKGFTFSCLYDETQDIVRAYMAAHNPDFILFDEDRRFVYRGQMDDSRLGSNVPVTGKDLREQDAVLEGKDVPGGQRAGESLLNTKKGNKTFAIKLLRLEKILWQKLKCRIPDTKSIYAT